MLFHFTSSSKFKGTSPGGSHTFWKNTEQLLISTENFFRNVPTYQCKVTMLPLRTFSEKNEVGLPHFYGIRPRQLCTLLISTHRWTLFGCLSNPLDYPLLNTRRSSFLCNSRSSAYYSWSLPLDYALPFSK